jgi:hypothetical protein
VEIAGLAIVGAIVVSAALVILRRRSGGDVHSVDGYRQTLSTLQTIRSRSSSSSVRVLGDPEGGPTPASAGAIRGPTGASATGGFPMQPVVERSGTTSAETGDLGPAAGAGWISPTARRPTTASAIDVDTPPGGLVFDDIARPIALRAPAPSNPPRRNRRKERAISAMNRGPRRIGGPLAAGVVVLGLVVALLIVGARSPNHSASTTSSTTSNHAGQTTATTAAGPATRSTATTTANAATHSTTTTHHDVTTKSGATGAPRTTTTTTTQPTQFAPVSTNSAGATYAPPAASYTLVVSTTNGRCWIEVKSMADGSVLAADTIDAGSQQSVPAQGAVSLVLGAPGVASVTLNGVPVVFPTGSYSPLTLTFSPPVQPTSTTSTTAPTSSTSSGH